VKIDVTALISSLTYSKVCESGTQNESGEGMLFQFFIVLIAPVSRQFHQCRWTRP